MQQQILDLLSMVAGGLLSLFVEIPAVKKLYDKFTDGQKRLIMSLMLILAGLIIYGVGCAGVLDILVPGLGLACTQAGAIVLVRIVLLAVASNQGIYGLVARGKPAPALPAPDTHPTPPMGERQ